jgi:hypothetical protein
MGNPRKNPPEQSHDDEQANRRNGDQQKFFVNVQIVTGGIAEQLAVFVHDPVN